MLYSAQLIEQVTNIAIAAMDEQSSRRLAVLASQLTMNPTSAATTVSFEPAQLQRILEHDNHETRARVKEFMHNNELYIP